MEFVIKKTTDLTKKEKESLLDCFVEVFEHERTMEEMCNQYLNTPMGYSIHALCLDDGRIVAANTAFPSYYWIGDKKVKAFITGDTMVRKGYRDGAIYLDLVFGLTDYMKRDGYAFSFGFPNENSYAVNKKGRLTKEFGRLDTYVLPYRIGGIKSSLRWLNPFSKIFCRLWLLCGKIGVKDEVSKPMVHKDDETFNSSRYKRMDGKYQHIKQDETEFYYKVKIHEGVRTAFLIDLIGKSEERFHHAVKYILEKENCNMDLLMYVGHLPKSIRNIGLIKIPRKHEPKHFYMTGKVYDKELDANCICSIENWDVNLSDYDII
jgi:hypothetical protein